MHTREVLSVAERESAILARLRIWKDHEVWKSKKSDMVNLGQPSSRASNRYDDCTCHVCGPVEVLFDLRRVFSVSMEFFFLSRIAMPQIGRQWFERQWIER